MPERIATFNVLELSTRRTAARTAAQLRAEFDATGVLVFPAFYSEAELVVVRRKLYGLASIERIAGARTLPYYDRIVNLLVADLDALGAVVFGIGQSLLPEADSLLDLLRWGWPAAQPSSVHPASPFQPCSRSFTDPDFFLLREGGDQGNYAIRKDSEASEGQASTLNLVVRSLGEDEVRWNRGRGGGGLFRLRRDLRTRECD